RPRLRRLLLVLGPRVVPVLLPARRAAAHLRALLALRDRGREGEVHLVQPVHARLPHGHRHHDARPARRAHARPGVPALLGVRARLPQRRAAVRERGRERLRVAGLARRLPGAHARAGLTGTGKTTRRRSWRRRPFSHYADGTEPSALPDVAGLQALRPLHDLELDALSLGKRLETLSLDRGEVDEDVLATLLRDETEALRVVEPLHGTRRHC